MQFFRITFGVQLSRGGPAKGGPGRALAVGRSPRAGSRGSPRLFNRVYFSACVFVFLSSCMTPDPDAVEKAADTVPEMKYRVNARLKGGVTYLGMDMEEDIVKPATPFKITHYWKAHKALKGWKIFVHLGGVKRSRHVSLDRAFLSGQKPPGMWKPGEIVKEEQIVSLPGDWKQPEARIYTGLFRKKKRMKVIAGTQKGEGRILAATIKVDRFSPLPDPEHITAAKTRKRINIDGKRNDAVWARTPEAVIKRRKDKLSADVKTAWDSRNIYVSVRVTQKLNKKRGFIRILIDPVGNGRGYADVRIDADGQGTGSIKSRDDNDLVRLDAATLKTACAVEEAAWTCETAIPFGIFRTHDGRKDKKTPRISDLVRMNFIYVPFSAGKKKKMLAWSPVSEKDIAKPFRFGFVSLGNHKALVPAAAKPRYSSVILISVDTLRRDHLPFYDYERNTAPNLSRFATGALVFDNAIAAATNTTPSHAAMLTGMYPLSSGVVRNCDKVRNDVPMLAEILRQHGFQTGAFVSGWTLRGKCASLQRGFDVYNDRFKSGTRTAEKTFAQASKWIGGLEKNLPVFLFFHLFDPHFDYEAPDSYAEHFLPKDQKSFLYPLSHRNLVSIRSGRERPGEVGEYVVRYDGEILYADDHVGKLLRLLKKRKIFDNSLIVFLSDHGETLGERNFQFDHGGRVYDEQLRVPLVIRFPRGKNGGTRSAAYAHHIDLMPTVLDFLGISGPDGLQGISLLDSLKTGPKKTVRDMFSVADSRPTRVTELRERTIKPGVVFSVRRKSDKLIRYPTQKGHLFELFDLEKDAEEKTNLIDDGGDLAETLAGRIHQWVMDTSGGRIQAPPALDEEDIEKLKSLGYMD